MKPIIKWSGGKSQEIKFFENYFPKKINTYIEPFAGGAAVFFNLEHKPSIINDINFELVSLYKIIHDKKMRNVFIKNLNIIETQREYFNDFFEKYSDEDIFEIFETIDIEINEYHFNFILKNNIKKDTIRYFIIEQYTKSSAPFNMELSLLLKKSFLDKIKRIKKIEEKENKKFTSKELKSHFTTSFQSALYFYSRNIYNKGYNLINTEFNISLSSYIANWYYVREFCYSSMFRFSKSGNFNVPYGGIGYNSKDFKTKINRLKEDTNLHDLLENSDINSGDFEELFNKYNYFSENDFIFLDPPYDSEFSQYNKEKDFDKEEQIRLRNSLLNVNCKYMIVIKETDFINELYSDRKVFKIKKFDKKYLTNMRNRNDKDVIHLIITNY